MKQLFGGGPGNRGYYTPVRQTDGNVYETTTEPNPESLSPLQTVFTNYLGGRLSSEGEKTKWVLTTLIIGICAISLGSVVIAVDPYQIILKMKVTLTDGGETFLMWKKPEVDLYLKVYLFNVTNSEEFIRGNSTRLRVSQVGPYVYREYLEHGQVRFNKNHTMTAVPLHPLKFIPELSNGTEKDILILPNIALLSIAQVTSQSSIFTRLGVNLLVKQTASQPLVPMTSREFMFGYKTTLVTLGNKFLPSWISFDKLGLIDRMYDFEGDTSTTFTGDDDIRRGGLLATYNRKTYLPQWRYPCNNLTGSSDGTKFPSLIRGNQELLFFRKSLCRSILLVKTGEGVIKGIHGNTYAIKNNSLDNGLYEPQNRCFCLEKCLPAGILDVQKCYYGFPIALSFPHFLDADPKVQASVDGIHPDRDIHSSYFVINEDAGLPLKLSVRMQINMAFGDLSKMAHVERFSNMILPMLWTDISLAELPPGINWRYYFYLTIGPIVQATLTFLLLICGLAFILLSLTSALFIPRMNLVSSNRNFASSREYMGSTSHPKQRYTTKDAYTPNADPKEMELYYSSLLDAPEE